jgi:hypothetical protein
MLNPDPTGRPEPAQILGILASAFPSFIDSRWAVYAPPRELIATPRLRTKSGRGCLAAKRKAVDLRELGSVPLEELVEMEKAAMANEQSEPEVAKRPKRIRVPIPVPAYS